jgi:Mu-like prophage protein gpG
MSKITTTQSLNFTLTVTDNSEEVLKALENAIDRALDAIGETAVGYAQDVITEAGRVDTGTMRGSVDTDHDERTVVIGTNLEYAPYHELGTSKGIKPIHFLKRAATEHTEEYKNLVKDSLENA